MRGIDRGVKENPFAVTVIMMTMSALKPGSAWVLNSIYLSLANVPTRGEIGGNGIFPDNANRTGLLGLKQTRKVIIL